MLTLDANKLIFSRGIPYPLGATCQKKGVNFALFSKHAKKVTLGLFEPGTPHPKVEIPLDPLQNKTGNIWHIQIENIPENYFYSYSLDGPQDPIHSFHPENWLIDPFTHRLNISSAWGENKERILGKIFPEEAFDWEKDTPLNLPFEELMIYEMHVRGMTKDPTSQVAHSGTYLGLIEKIPYLKELGINAVELLPVYEFDETKNHYKDPVTGTSLFNYWGYMTVNFFSPMARFATSAVTSIAEFKQMVKEFHKAGIEVILDVVFNHTGEKDPKEPPFSFRGIDNDVYYMVDDKGEALDFTGCGNTFNCNHPIVIQFILSALRYWVAEMHVDGFRFDLASVFCRGIEGHVLSHSPLVSAINHDPILANTKLIAEAWDATGTLYQVGSFPGGKRWAEWNGKFRDITRSFLKGDRNKVGAFATALAGSQDLYGTRAPFNSINFVTAHDGFTLRDLVSYNEKHNEENGENNRDGSNDNISWNCGVEGATDQVEIEALRSRQIRNFLLALTVAIGTPMYLMGDEYGHTRFGNNNAYCQDNKINYFLWDELQKNSDLLHYFQKLVHFRKNSPLFKRKTFLTDKDVSWHGETPEAPHWCEDSHLLAYTLKDLENHHDLYIAFNAQNNPVTVLLPSPSPGKKWVRIIDTSLPLETEVEVPLKYHLIPFSALLLKQM